MSENIPNHEHLTVVSHARDVTLHFGELREGDDVEPRHVITEKTDVAVKGDLWDAVLLSREFHASDRYVLYLKNHTTSDTYGYIYNVIDDRFEYEFPIGTAVDMSQDRVANQMGGWLAKCWPTPDAVVFDAHGEEWHRQVELMSISARLAIAEVQKEDEGDRI